jgi:hypothetical protein
MPDPLPWSTRTGWSLEKLEERKASLFELRNELPESCHAPREALSLLQTSRGLHAINCFHLLWVHFDAMTQHEEAQELPPWYSEHALLKVELEPGGSHAIKGF